MTTEQLKRWKDFALRMARIVYKNNRRPDCEWITEVVSDFFDGIDDGCIYEIIDWDSSPSYICDKVTCLLDGYCGNLWIYEDDDDKREARRERAFEQWDDQWGGPVRCCIRSGLDLASSPSAGVVGFNAGHIRKIYPEGVPNWIKAEWFDKDENKINFDEMKDETSLWL